MASKPKRPHLRLMQMYNKRAKAYGEGYLRKRLWRIKSMYGQDDVRQDAFAVYLGVFRRHPGKSEEDLFRVYKQALWGRVQNRSRQCFPNSYCYVEGTGKLVVDVEDITTTYTYQHEMESCLDSISDLLTKLPKELGEVLKLIVEDFCGGQCIEQKKSRKLSGKIRCEPVAISIARKLGLDPSVDVFDELAKTLNH